MPINVNADVVDLRVDQPKSTDNFFVDTNVWLWVGYSNVSIDAQPYQVKNYPNYLNNALANKSTLNKSTLSFSELGHVIESIELKIFNRTKQTQHKPKYFRHNFPAERQNVVQQVDNAWNLAELMTNMQSIEANITTALIQASIHRMQSQALDGYDIFMVETMTAANITQVITDDSDFGQVSGLTIFTANNRLINDARTQGKLVKR